MTPLELKIKLKEREQKEANKIVNSFNFDVNIFDKILEVAQSGENYITLFHDEKLVQAFKALGYNVSKPFTDSRKTDKYMIVSWGGIIYNPAESQTNINDEFTKNITT